MALAAPLASAQLFPGPPLRGTGGWAVEAMPAPGSRIAVADVAGAWRELGRHGAKFIINMKIVAIIVLIVRQQKIT